MRGLRYIVLLLMTVCVGCSTSADTLALIEQSERVAIDYPDSALILIERVDPDRVYGKRDKAHYRLAYSEALYHNQIDSDCDSLTRPLFDYYYDSDLHAERARAMYQHGLVMVNRCNYPEAIHILLEAEKSLQHCDNPRLLGLVYRTLGDIYYSQSIFGEAITAYTMAKECFNKANLPYHSLYSIYNIGLTYSIVRKFDYAIESLLEAVEFTSKHDYNSLRYMIIAALCFAYLQIDDYDNCQKWFDCLDVNDTDSIGLQRYNCIKALLELNAGNFDSASMLLQQAKDITPNTSLYVMHAELQLLISQNRYEDALELYSELIKLQDDSFLTLIDGSSSHEQLVYVENNMKLLTRLNQRSKVITYLVILVCIVILVFVAYITNTKNREKQEKIDRLSNQVVSVKQELSNQNQRNKHLLNIATEREQVEMSMRRQLLENIGISLQNIDSLLSSYYTDSTRRVKQNQIIDAIDSYVSEFASNENGYFAVERYVNQSRNNIMQTLRSEMPALNERDYMLLCLIYADFSTNAICMFMGYDKNKLYKHKCRLKAKIAESGCKSMSTLLKYL